MREVLYGGSTDSGLVQNSVVLVNVAGVVWVTVVGEAEHASDHHHRA